MGTQNEWTNVSKVKQFWNPRNIHNKNPDGKNNFDKICFYVQPYQISIQLKHFLVIEVQNKKTQDVNNLIRVMSELKIKS